MAKQHFALERIPGNPPLPPESDLEAIARTYADAFAGPPWNESARCPVDSTFYGKDQVLGAPSPCCNVALDPAYPLAETSAYIRDELERPDAALFLLRDQKRDVAGFSWGFSYDDPEQFAAKKYRTAEMRQVIAGLLGSAGITGKFYYLSESGLIDSPAVRGQGLSRQFHARRLEIAAGLGLPAVQRTSSIGPMYRTSQRSGMQQIMGPEMIVDTATRTFIPTGRIVNDCQDTEQPERVLFAAQ